MYEKNMPLILLRSEVLGVLKFNGSARGPLGVSMTCSGAGAGSGFRWISVGLPESRISESFCMDIPETSALIALASSNRCEYLGARSVAGTLFLLSVPEAEDSNDASAFAPRFSVDGLDLLGGIALRPRGVKSGTSIDGSLFTPPRALTLVFAEAIGVERGVEGGATLPARCFFCNALTRCRSISLTCNISQ